VQRQAPRLFVRSFGALAIHRGAWDGPIVSVDRRRIRTMLGLLVAYSDSALTRDMVLDIMWPDADPSAAINSLNQTVFQLRRSIDPDYRDGESAQYIISTVDLVQLNPHLVRTDLGEFRSLVVAPEAWRTQTSATASNLVRMIRGPFLSELRYEDWATRVQTSVHAEIRDCLLPLATAEGDLTPDLRIRAASALIDLDEFDDDAYVALAGHLATSGRQAAARQLIVRYAKRIEEELADTPSPPIAELLQKLGPAGFSESTNS
jgi:DNA-binding SARP family transcriptional activator